jgi:hypothetical protein
MRQGRRRLPNAWHYAFLDAHTTPIRSPDGDLAADPLGFDRSRFLKQLGQKLWRLFRGQPVASAEAEVTSAASR